MTAEEKLLLMDLGARLSSELKIKTSKGDGVLCSIDLIPDGAYLGISINGAVKDYFEFQDTNPYPRSMENMTEEEKEMMKGSVICFNEFEAHSTLFDDTGFDWLIANHFDYRGLIPWGLALEASADMYK